MTNTLDHVDQIIERTKVSYAEAKEALDACNGDVLEAIIKIESSKSNKSESGTKSEKSNFDAQLKFALKQAGKILSKGLQIKVLWKKETQTLLELPLLIVLIATLWLMPFSLLVLALPFFFGVRMQINRGNGKVTDVNDWIKKQSQSDDH